MKKRLLKHKDYILTALVLVLVLYIAYDKGSQFLNETKQQIFQQGYSKATQESAQLLIKGTENCKAIAVSNGSKTINVITSDCATIMYQQSYMKGVKDTVTKIMNDSKTCKPISISDGVNSDNFIAVSCLQTQPTT